MAEQVTPDDQKSTNELSMNETDLLTEIRSKPDDDVLRLMYADFLEERGDERAELIRLQLEMDALEEGDPEREQMASVESDLVRNRRRELLAALKTLGVRDLRFQRGLPEKVLVQGTAFLDRPRTWFRHLPVIRALMWRGLKVTDNTQSLAKLAGFEQLSCLTALDLSGCNTRGTGLRELASAAFIGSLVRLRLGSNHLYGDGMQALCDLRVQRLETLDLSRNELGVSDVRQLVRSEIVTRVQDLSLAGNQLGDDSMLKISNAPELRRLQTLDLSHNQIGVDGVTRWTESSTLDELSELMLSNNPIGPLGINRLATASSTGRLTRLEIGTCELGEDGLTALSSSPYFGRLVTLNLESNGLGRSIETLMHLKSPELTSLNLAGNALRPAGVQRLLKQANWPKLKELNLGENELDGRGLGELLSLPSIRRLRTLDLSRNRLTADATLVVLERLDGASWETVDLRGNPVTAGDLQIPRTKTRVLLDA